MLSSGLLPCVQGYGFLSENATFVEICGDHGINFIGPSPDNIRTMGDKSTARDTMKASGIEQGIRYLREHCATALPHCVCLLPLIMADMAFLYSCR